MSEPVVTEPAPRVRCASCGDELTSYFEASGNVLCEPCKDKAVAANGASHVPTLLRGGFYGFLAAAVGAGIYYAISELTGYEFGLMSIVLGLMVGFAVRAGARGRGGWRYQALAMFLCYAAICATYVPRVISAVRAQQSPDQKTQPQVAAGNAQPAVEPATPAAQAAPAAAPVKPSIGRFFGALGMLFVFSLAIPFLAGLSNFMGLIIIAIGLYEAWKVNRGVPFSVNGPFEVGTARGG